MYKIRFYIDRTEWSARQAKAGAISKSIKKWDVENRWRWDGHQQRAPENVVQDDFPDEESVRSNWVWQVLCDKTTRRCQLPSYFYSPVCRKNVSVLTHEHHKVLWHFEGSRHFARDQPLPLETPGWRVLDFHGNPLSEDELEHQREKIRKSPLVVRDREHPFAEDLITDEAGVVDPQLSVLTKMSCLVDALRMGSSYELIEKLWAQFVVTAGPNNIEVAWTRDEVLVSSVNFRDHFVSFSIHIVVLILVNHRYWNSASKSFARGWLG